MLQGICEFPHTTRLTHQDPCRTSPARVKICQVRPFSDLPCGSVGGATGAGVSATPRAYDAAKVSLAYSGKGVDVSFESAGGFRLRLHGEADDSLDGARQQARQVRVARRHAVEEAMECPRLDPQVELAFGRIKQRQRPAQS